MDVHLTRRTGFSQLLTSKVTENLDLNRRMDVGIEREFSPSAKWSKKRRLYSRIRLEKQ